MNSILSNKRTFSDFDNSRVQSINIKKLKPTNKLKRRWLRTTEMETTKRTKPTLIKDHYMLTIRARVPPKSILLEENKSNAQGPFDITQFEVRKNIALWLERRCCLQKLGIALADCTPCWEQNRIGQVLWIHSTVLPPQRTEWHQSEEMQCDTSVLSALRYVLEPEFGNWQFFVCLNQRQHVVCLDYYNKSDSEFINTPHWDHVSAAFYHRWQEVSRKLTMVPHSKTRLEEMNQLLSNKIASKFVQLILPHLYC